MNLFQLVLLIFILVMTTPDALSLLRVAGRGLSCELRVEETGETQLTLTIRIVNRTGIARCLYNPQFASAVGIPGKIDVFDDTGRYLGALLSEPNPFGGAGTLAEYHWMYPYDGSAVEATIACRTGQLRAIDLARAGRSERLVPGQRCRFQLVVYELMFNAPSLLRSFHGDVQAMVRWQHSGDFRDLIKSEPVRVQLPRKVNQP